MKWHNPPLNSVGFPGALMMLEAFYIAQTYADAPSTIRLAAIGLGFVFGIVSYRSFRLFGFKIR